ncbi:MAG TPA: type II secretion system protein GspN, partial [Deferrisomatales bacterium]|nr:type II secretion system protein GspN [Deferrisomatales bacterium]
MGNPSSWRRRLLRGSGYLALVVVTYLVALWQLLPYEEVGHRIEAALRTRGVGAEVEGLGPGGVLGCAADAVTLYPAELPDLRWQLTGMNLRLLPQGLLTAEPAVALDGATLGGQIEATARWQQPPRIDVRWQDLLLAKLPLPPAAEGLLLTGRVSGTLQ